MTELRRRMLEEPRLRNYSPNLAVRTTVSPLDRLPDTVDLTAVR